MFPCRRLYDTATSTPSAPSTASLPLQTFGMTLIPSIVNLTLANTSPDAIEQGQAFIDCVGWTNALREAIDTNGGRTLLAPAQRQGCFRAAGSAHALPRCMLQASSHCVDMPAPLWSLHLSHLFKCRLAATGELQSGAPHRPLLLPKNLATGEARRAMQAPLPTQRAAPT
jgi:hypothetical protein